MNKTLTVIILTKNEEEMLPDCLESVSFADKILVIDNNSSDKTTEIAKKAGAQVIVSDLNDFAARRSLPLKKITTDFILYIDADERVSQELADEIATVISNDAYTAAYRIPRKNFYLGNHPWPKVELLERLFMTTKLKGWHGKLHETAQVDGVVGQLKSPILHYTHRTLSSMVEKTNIWSEVEASLRLDNNHPKMTWWRFPRVMLGAFWDSYIKQQGYKAGTAGLIESMYLGFSIFITYAKLWEMQQEKKK